LKREVLEAAQAGDPQVAVIFWFSSISSLNPLNHCRWHWS